jgi:hypothetical protein
MTISEFIYFYEKHFKMMNRSDPESDQEHDQIEIS